MKSIKITQDYVSYQQKLLNSIDSWKDEASCKKASSKENFFDTSESSLKNLAKKYCRNCPVQRHCLYTSLVTSEIYGLWGGLTPKQRKTYYKYVLVKAQENDVSIDVWSSDLNDIFQKYSNPPRVKEVFPINN